jgi:triacylglycerol esterase/lipase EstA (alpha/beta hydrolase family)
VITALTLAAAVVGGAFAYGWLAYAGIRSGWNPLWFVAGLPVACFLIPAALSLQWLTLSWLFRAPRPAQVRLGGAALARLYWGETLAITASVPRMIGYRLLMTDPPPARATLPVLLLHGVLCNAGVWHPLRHYLATRAIGPTYALSYGPPLASIEAFAAQTAACIDAILAATGARQVVIVAHSMGGLVARAYLRQQGGAKVRRLITIGTPHHGSVLAYILPGISLSQLRPGNPWLQELGAAPAPARPPIVSLWSWHDTMVAPQTSSVLEGAENVALAGIGHNALLGDSEVFRRVAAEIERATTLESRLPETTQAAIDHATAAGRGRA